MDQVRVNLTLNKNIWGTFTLLVPKRKKSKIINDLLKEEVIKIQRRQEQQIMAAAFREASEDKERLATIREWESLDVEGWE